MKRYISPSVMCADLMHLADEIKTLEMCGAEYVHIDIMDGMFVPNYALGTDLVERLRGVTALPLDIHLMVERPEEKLSFFHFRPGDIVCMHIEAMRHPQRALNMLRSQGVLAGLALNPATSLSVLEYLYDDLDAVLLMTVNPGFAGQKIIPVALDKVALLRAELTRRGRDDVLIEVDGNVSFENAKKMALQGANIFVAGTSSVYHTGDTQENNFARLRMCIQQKPTANIFPEF